MFNEYDNLTTGVFHVTDGTDVLLPTSEYHLQTGNPLTLAFAHPSKPYRMAYCYRTVVVPDGDIASIVYGCTLKFSDVDSVANCQQVELDMDYCDGTMQRNGGIAARFVGENSGYWHQFDVTKQQWVCTYDLLPKAAEWLAGVKIGVVNGISDTGLTFNELVVNNERFGGCYFAQGRPSGAKHINVALQLDAQAVPKPMTIQWSNLMLGTMTF